MTQTLDEPKATISVPVIIEDIIEGIYCISEEDYRPPADPCELQRHLRYALDTLVPAYELISKHSVLPWMSDAVASKALRAFALNMDFDCDPMKKPPMSPTASLTQLLATMVYKAYMLYLAYLEVLGHDSPEDVAQRSVGTLNDMFRTPRAIISLAASLNLGCPEKGEDSDNEDLEIQKLIDSLPDPEELEQ